MPTPIVLSGLQEIISLYDAFLIDIWGVIHNGKQLYPNVVEAFQKLKTLGKQIIILSNAPRRCSVAKEKLATMGLYPELYNDIYTSGEDCYQALQRRTSSWYQKLGNRLYHLGPTRDRSIFAELSAYSLTEKINEADFILMTGTLTFEDQLQDYLPLLQQALELKLPAIAANSDKEVMYGKKKIIAVGAIAEAYKRMGGDVYMHGKPDPKVYLYAHEQLPSSMGRTIMIGDSLATDIKGAQNYGIDSVFILQGIHNEILIPSKLSLPQKLGLLCQQKKITPKYAMVTLQY